MIDLSQLQADLNAAEIVTAVSEMLREKNIADIRRERIETLKTLCNRYVPANEMPDFLQYLLLRTVNGLDAKAVSNA